MNTAEEDVSGETSMPSELSIQDSQPLALKAYGFWTALLPFFFSDVEQTSKATV